MSGANAYRRQPARRGRICGSPGGGPARETGPRSRLPGRPQGLSRRAALARRFHRGALPGQGLPAVGRGSPPGSPRRCSPGAGTRRRATSTLSARAAVHTRIAAPWLTMATARAPLAAASATTASYRARASSPLSPPGMRSAVSPAAQANTVRRYSRPSGVCPGSISRSPADSSRMPSRTVTPRPRAAASGAAVSWVRISVEAYRASMSLAGECLGQRGGLRLAERGQPRSGGTAVSSRWSTLDGVSPWRTRSRRIRVLLSRRRPAPGDTRSGHFRVTAPHEPRPDLTGAATAARTPLRTLLALDGRLRGSRRLALARRRTRPAPPEPQREPRRAVVRDGRRDGREPHARARRAAARGWPRSPWRR